VVAPFRAGIVLGGARSGREWADTARRVEQQGFTALLVPDTLWTPSPFPALAAAAAVTSRLTLRTWVLAAPLRTPAAVVREVAALQLLSDGRFELGIGTGRPDAEEEAARLGAHWGPVRERIARVERVVSGVRAQVTPAPPVVITASGPRMLAVAGRVADRFAPALPPDATEPALAGAVARCRRAAAGRAAGSPGVLQLGGVGSRLPTWLTRQAGLDAAELAAAGAVAVLPADPAAMAEQLTALRERYGVSEITVPAELCDDVAPVLSLLD
jgi:alkanesulfonate monooxygenase SsuD/methylene tetrahydromethanopterin reductase-like flavin-dependent oxidoreductase (luciferase family)